MSAETGRGFRRLPWRLSWQIFLATFLFVLGVNYAIVRYTSKKQLFNRQRDDTDSSIRSMQCVVSDETKEILALRQGLDAIRIESGLQRQSIQHLQKNSDSPIAGMHHGSKETAELLSSVDRVSRAVDDQGQALEKIASDISTLRVCLEQLHDAKQSGSRP